MIRIVPLHLAEANAFVAEHHRHNKPTTGHKFSIGLRDEFGELIGVAIAGRPVARALDDGFTLEVNRTCTDSTPNANSSLYGAIWRAARAMGYTRLITYTQADELGASLRAAGFVRDADLAARGSWAESSGEKHRRGRTTNHGGVPRVRWILACQPAYIQRKN